MTLPLKAGLFNLKELSPKKAAVSFSLILLLLQSSSFLTLWKVLIEFQ